MPQIQSNNKLLYVCNTECGLWSSFCIKYDFKTGGKLCGKTTFQKIKKKKEIAENEIRKNSFTDDDERFEVKICLFKIGLEI